MEHPVTLVTPDGPVVLQCGRQKTILEVARAAGLTLPATCCGGACSACVAKLRSGQAPDQSEQSYLSPEDIEVGFVLLCVAFAEGPCVLLTHQANAYTDCLAGLSP